MATLKSLISGAMTAAVLLGCAEGALAHRLRERVFDPETGTSFRTEVRHRHTRSGRVILLGDGQEFGRASRSFGGQGILGGPVTTYRTYTDSDPYYSGGHRFYDRGEYRYYRDNDGSVLGRVLRSVVR